MASQKTPLAKPVFVQVADLQPGTHGHNIVVKVVSVSMIAERKRTDGTTICIAEAVLGDASGCIILTAKNDQINILKEGATVIIRNAKVNMFKGFMRLIVDKWGLVEVSPEPLQAEPNMNNNLSAVEYELVTVNE